MVSWGIPYFIADTGFNMTHQVTLNPINASFRADGHETVLEAALRHDLLVPYGCRTGG